MSREEIAVDKRRLNGYNCAQAVVCTYCEDLGLDEKTAFVVAEGFGGGMGCTKSTCGALCGAVMAAGLKNSTADMQKGSSKGTTYLTTRQMVKRFEEEAGALRCRDIKGIETGKMLCDCADCVRIACRLVEDLVL